MEEKKLTDEEVVKAWECHIRDGVTCGKDCPYREKDISCLGGRHARDTLDLIHRLQSENAEYARKLDDGELVSTDWHDEQVLHAENVIEEQRAEIERLTEDKSFATRKMMESKAKAVELQKQVDELKWKKIILETCVEHWSVSYGEKTLENAELQKQVDELKEQNEVFKKIFDNTNGSSITEEQIINAMNSFYREQAEHLFELKKEQAVKDTAKEIYDELKNEVISVDIPCGGEPCEEDCRAVLWWKIEKILRKKAQVE